MLLVMFKVKMMQMGTKIMSMTMKRRGRIFSVSRRSISEVDEANEDKNESLLGEHLTEATTSAEMTASAAKRENERRESAKRKSLRMTGDYEWVLERARRK